MLLVSWTYCPLHGLSVIKYCPSLPSEIKSTESQILLSWLLHHPTCFRVWRRGSWDPQKISLHLFSRWDTGECQTLGFGSVSLLFVWSPVAFFACLFFWLGFQSCSLVSSFFLVCSVSLCATFVGYLTPRHGMAHVFFFLGICFIVATGSC